MASLIIIAGPDQGKEIHIQEPSFSLGRGKTADLCLNDHTISRTHAIISVKEGHFVIEDQHSINGIWVNEEKFASKELAHGDLIVLGNTHIRFMNPPSSSDIQIIDTGDSFDFDRSIIMSMEEIENLKAKPTKEVQSREKDEIAQKNYRKLHVMLRISDAVANILDLKELISELMNVIFDETRASR
jgi:pSer/pThr/pTyr-binding forkhead associated (FHA) protein